MRWEGDLDQKEGTIEDLSVGGCFILTGHLVKRGELIRLEIEPQTQSLVVWGEVIYQIEEMGFGLKFISITEEVKQQLAGLVRAAKESAKGP